MTMARGMRCKSAKTTDCLNCPYEQCIHDLEDMEAVETMEQVALTIENQTSQMQETKWARFPKRLYF